MPGPILQSPVTLEEYSAVEMAERRHVWLDISDISEADFEHHMATQKAREALVPKIGERAPDFTAEVLDRAKERTGQTIQLSALRGKPVALTFGSYT
jgi:hypothetical protein